MGFSSNLFAKLHLALPIHIPGICSGYFARILRGKRSTKMLSIQKDSHILAFLWLYRRACQEYHTAGFGLFSKTQKPPKVHQTSEQLLSILPRFSSLCEKTSYKTSVAPGALLGTTIFLICTMLLHDHACSKKNVVILARYIVAPLYIDKITLSLGVLGVSHLTKLLLGRTIFQKFTFSFTLFTLISLLCPPPFYPSLLSCTFLYSIDMVDMKTEFFF